MFDINSMKMWEVFNDYIFFEAPHQYYYKDNPVKYSVTQFINRFFEPFNSETISKRYAEKHGLNQKDVLNEWKRRGDISALAGTIIHSHMENLKRGKILNFDYSTADKLNLHKEVEERVNVLLPQAEAFHKDTLNRLFPIKLEYTVGIENYIAGNIDMLCWNKKTQQVQIWDYKCVKELAFTPKPWTTNCYYPFNKYKDTNYIHYSIQLNIYKNILSRYVDVPIGKCYLVVFNYECPQTGFDVVECLDLQYECKLVLNQLVNGEIT